MTAHIHIPGRAGEVIFALGLVPTLRARHGRVVIHTLPAYAAVLDLFEPSADEIVEIATPLPVGEHVVEHVKHVIENYPKDDTVVGGEWHFHLYSTHFWWSAPSHITEGSFVRAFCEVAYLAFEDYVWPRYTGAQYPRDHVLALPTTHPGSSLHECLPVSASTWRNWAELLHQRSLQALATGHPKDGPEGWSWLSLTEAGWHWIVGDLRDAIDLVQRARLIIAANSGLAFTGLLGGAHVICLDDTGYKQSLALYPEDLPEEMRARFSVLRLHGHVHVDVEAIVEAAVASLIRKTLEPTLVEPPPEPVESAEIESPEPPETESSTADIEEAPDAPSE